MSDNTSWGTTEVSPIQGSGGTAIKSDTVTIPRAKYEALWAVAKALKRVRTHPEYNACLCGKSGCATLEADDALAALHAAGIDPSEDKAEALMAARDKAIKSLDRLIADYEDVADASDTDARQVFEEARMALAALRAAGIQTEG